MEIRIPTGPAPRVQCASIQSFPPDLRQALEAIAARQQFPSGYLLFRQDEKAASVFLVCSGQVRVYASSNGHRSLELGRFTSGDIFGMAEILAHQNHPYFAETVGLATVGVVPARRFQDFLAHQPGACFHMVRVLSEQVGAAYQQMRGFSGIGM
jgi:CRP/FNR family cyclic AMP-dependent transcriptional regulator